MWELDCEVSWAPKNWCFWTVVLEKTLERPLYCKEIQPVHSKGDRSWVFFGRNDAKAETLVLWPPHAKSWLIGKLWWWEGLGAGGEGDDRGGDGWMASLTRWTWVWVNSRSWWWTGRPGELQFMGLQSRTRLSDWTELNWMSMCRVFFCVVGRGCLLCPMCSLGKALLAFDLLHFVLQGQICLLLQVYLDFLLCIPFPYNEKGIFLGC